MGLDQYAYVANKVGNTTESSTELAYWRKHPNLHGWMEQLWNAKGCPGVEAGFNDIMFNGIEFELTWDDIVKLEEDIKNNNLPNTTGFFFGNNSDEYYKAQDLEFVYEAKSRLFLGQKVFYNSSW
jgi:hypothetical protein